jgi:putative tryptophan/tyrosine transport system substrate-binding protein
VNFGGLQNPATASSDAKARLVDKILRGARAGDLPVEQPDRYVTEVNLKTARALGIVLPPSMIAAAEEIIE